MAWVRVNNKWVDDAAPARPQAVVPDAPADRPGLLDDVTREFNENPVVFMRKNSLSPPHDSGGGDVGDAIGAASTLARGGPAVSLTMGGGRRFIKIANHPLFPGAKTLQFVANGLTNGSSIPIEWLPWQTLKIVKRTIPAVPNSLYNPQDIDYPRIFFTAGINGCSVFVQGQAEGPTITHAGIDGSLAHAADSFWRDHLGALNPGAVRGEVNTFDYMKNRAGSAAGVDNQVKQYVSWLNKDQAPTAKIVYFGQFGCVFGVRHGRTWTIYLQKNVTVEEATLYKESEVEKHAHGYRVKRTGAAAVFHETRRENQHVFGQATPWKVDKKTFRSVVRIVSKSMQVGEIFPRRMIDTNLVPEWRFNAG